MGLLFDQGFLCRAGRWHVLLLTPHLGDRQGRGAILVFSMTLWKGECDKKLMFMNKELAWLFHMDASISFKIDKYLVEQSFVIGILPGELCCTTQGLMVWAFVNYFLK